MATDGFRENPLLEGVRRSIQRDRAALAQPNAIQFGGLNALANIQDTGSALAGAVGFRDFSNRSQCPVHGFEPAPSGLLNRCSGH